MSSSDDSERSTLYRTRLAPRALRDAEEIYEYIAGEAPLAAEHLIAELFEAIESLASFPHRCAHASEEEHLCIGLRQLIVGNYRILFTVDDDHRVVNVPHIRHGARRSIDRGDITE